MEGQCRNYAVGDQAKGQASSHDPANAIPEFRPMRVPDPRGVSGWNSRMGNGGLTPWQRMLR
jgi:hypothetical protein